MDLSIAIARLQEIDGLDHHGRYGRLAREAIKALKPDPVPWDANWNRSYDPVEKRAQEIYASFEYDGPGKKPDWTPGGNGLKQDVARHLARRELLLEGHTP